MILSEVVMLVNFVGVLEGSACLVGSKTNSMASRDLKDDSELFGIALIKLT